MNLKKLAGELDNLREGIEDDPERQAELVRLERNLGGDLHIASRNLSLIADDDFEEYALTLAEDLHGRLNSWPFNCIDWKEAASELQTDYTSVEFDGDTYWYQA